jgi:serine/threonine-protein kinase
MALPAGSSLGAYEIQSPLGSGGMGEVYRARDRKLGRAVAIKVLPEAVERDPDRIARFEREARVLALLNHPHIAALYGMERSGDRHFLIMELVDGETLADRLRRGALPVEEALRIAIQIADALEAAHEKGIIHRDLKPANIKISPDDQVKVLDFGLAKALGPPEGGPHEPPSVGAGFSRPDGTHSPTLSLMATQAGMILGTAAYMSPEQAKGLPADHRSDIFSFGSVLYEMLTSRHPFQGDTVPDILASVLAREADLVALPPNLHPRLADLLRRCLEKNPKRRWQAVGDVRSELESIAAAPAAPAAIVSPTEPVRGRLALVGAVALLLGGLLSGTAVWFAATAATTAPQVAHLDVVLPRGAALSISAVDRDLSISADGSRIVYVGGNGTQLFVRPIDAPDPTMIFSGGSVREPAVSPNGQWVGFVDLNVVKKVAITGGPAVTLAVTSAAPRGLTWISDDLIVFGTTAPTGLQQVSAAGGDETVSTLTQPDRTRGEVDHFWPELLPGGRAVLFTITAAGGVNATQIAVLDLQAGTYKVLVRGGTHAQYAASGHLVYAASGTLRAVPFDLASLETRGTPVPVVPDVVDTGVGSVEAAIAANGTLVYVGGTSDVGQRTLVWADRQGRDVPIAAPPRNYVYPRISPDGTRAVVWINDQDSDIWSWNIGRSTLTRVTFDPGLDAYPTWTPDGRRIVVSSERAGARNLFWQAADGTGAFERITESPNLQNASSVSPDGRLLLFQETALGTGEDVMQIELTGARRLTPLIQTPFAERNGTISPDGKWLAYEANDSGVFEIYVRPFPDVGSGLWQVSIGGGTRPLWARGGEELFYLSATGAVMRVGVERGTSWASTPPSMIVKAEGYFTVPGANPGRTYDVTPDGQRFLMIKTAGDAGGTGVSSINVVVNWFEELKAKVPRR